MVEMESPPAVETVTLNSEPPRNRDSIVIPNTKLAHDVFFGADLRGATFQPPLSPS